MAKPSAPKPNQTGHIATKLVAVLASGLWIALCFGYAWRSIGQQGILQLSPASLGLLLLGTASVPGIIWAAIGYAVTMRRMERASRIMARHFRDFTKFSADERLEVAQSSEAARRESLSLFEAAQASLTALNQIQDSLKENTQALIHAAGQSASAIDGAGKQIETRAAGLQGLTSAFQDRSAELQSRAIEAAAALEAILARMDQSQNNMGDKAVRLDETTERTVARLHLGGEAIHATLSGLQDAASLLENRREDIQRTADDVAGKLNHAGDRIGHELRAIDDATRQSSESVMARLEGLRGAAIGGVSHLENMAERLQERSQALTEALKAQSTTMGQSVASMAENAFGSLNQKAGEITFTVSTAVNRLSELTRGLQAARSEIDEATNGASNKMGAIAASMRGEFTGIHEMADRALEQLQRTLSVVAATSANLDNETQTLEQRIAATFRAAEAGSADFVRQMGMALEQIGRAEQSFSEGQARIAGTAESSSAHLLQLTESLASGGAELGKTAMITSERIVAASGVVETRLQSVSDIADQVRSALGAFASDLGQVSQQSESIAQQIADSGAILRDNVVQIAKSAEDAAGTVKATTADLLRGAMEISDTAGRTRTEIVRATADLKREGAAIADTQAEARAMAGQVSAHLSERATELANNARRLAAETVTMREANAKFQRDMFLSAANTVLHALTALSVDIAHVLDTDLPEELRLELVRGDIPGFVRRLAAQRNDVSTPRLRARFATDTRFRNHVQVYLSQFEELLTQAAKVDQGAVLSATLVSSDIGKIYTFLSAAISTERDDKREIG